MFEDRLWTPNMSNALLTQCIKNNCLFFNLTIQNRSALPITLERIEYKFNSNIISTLKQQFFKKKYNHQCPHPSNHNMLTNTLPCSLTFGSTYKFLTDTAFLASFIKGATNSSRIKSIKVTPCFNLGKGAL